MLKSLDSLLLYVKDPQASAEFYEKLGFMPVNKDKDYSTVRLNWFKINFQNQESAEFKKESTEDKGHGMYVYLRAESVDEFYKFCLDKGFSPSSEPRDWPWGNREFVLRDPDGYKLVFYEPIKKRS